MKKLCFSKISLFEILLFFPSLFKDYCWAHTDGRIFVVKAAFLPKNVHESVLFARPKHAFILGDLTRTSEGSNLFSMGVYELIETKILISKNILALKTTKSTV